MNGKEFRLVLLPAFDGTGLLFSEFIKNLDDRIKCIPIAYPETGPQDYDSLTSYVRLQIPGDDPYIVLGESFAGPLVYRLATQDTQRCQAAIFVATYLTNPSPFLLKILTRMPAKLLSLFVSNSWVIKKLTLSKRAEHHIASNIAQRYGSVAAQTIKNRLHTISQIQEAPLKAIDIPSYYLQATEDKLVRPRQIPDFETLCKKLEIRVTQGGHFVLQENPVSAAQIIQRWLVANK